MNFLFKDGEFLSSPPSSMFVIHEAMRICTYFSSRLSFLFVGLDEDETYHAIFT